MGRPKNVRAPLPPIWRLSGEQWAVAESVLAEHDPPAAKGPDRVDQRAVLDAVIYRLRTGCQWNRLPKEFPSDSSVHRTFQRWLARGVLDRVWAEVAEAAGIVWEQQVVDAALGKARLGGSWSVPTPPTVASGA